MLNQPAPVEEFDEDQVPVIDLDKTEPVTIKFFLEELERFRRDGVSVEVWGNDDDAA
jgi:hypothetical protein